MFKPLFEKRHFEWPADFAKWYLLPVDMERLAKELRSTNPNFNEDRFLKAATRKPFKFNRE
jgi:hypothetical protein